MLYIIHYVDGNAQHKNFDALSMYGARSKAVTIINTNLSSEYLAQAIFERTFKGKDYLIGTIVDLGVMAFDGDFRQNEGKADGIQKELLVILNKEKKRMQEAELE